MSAGYEFVHVTKRATVTERQTVTDKVCKFSYARRRVNLHM